MQEKILDLGWSVLSHPPYSPDLTSSDFHLFCSLQNALNDKKFSQEDEVKTFVENIFNLKPAEFYLREINKLSNKWQEVIQNNGKYTID